MHDEYFATRLAHSAHKVADKAIAIGFVNANSVLDGHWHTDPIDHRLDAVRHQLRLGHQASAKSTTLHPLTGAAAVQVDLVIAPLLAQSGAMRQISRLATAQLQGERVLLNVKAQVTLNVAMNQSAGGDHFCVKQRMARQQAVKVAAMSICPIHHGRNGHAPRGCVGV